MVSRISHIVIYTCLFASILISCAEHGEERARKHGEEIWFTETLHDYGEIAEKSDGSYTFLFRNISGKPLIINRVRSNCGCTVPSWPREPIEPGDNGKITVRYNTELTGSFIKSIYVYSSAANSPVKLQIKGKVIPNKTTEDAKHID